MTSIVCVLICVFDIFSSQNIITSTFQHELVSCGAVMYILDLFVFAGSYTSVVTLSQFQPKLFSPEGCRTSVLGKLLILCLSKMNENKKA